MCMSSMRVRMPLVCLVLACLLRHPLFSVLCIRNFAPWHFWPLTASLGWEVGRRELATVVDFSFRGKSRGAIGKSATKCAAEFSGGSGHKLAAEQAETLEAKVFKFWVAVANSRDVAKEGGSKERMPLIMTRVGPPQEMR